MGEDKTVRATLTIRGRVQRVGYRDIVERAAWESGLRGYVENLKGGDVKTVCEGERTSIESLIEAIRIRDGMVMVDTIDIEWGGAAGEYEHFDIRHGSIGEELDERMVAGIQYMKDIGTKVEGVGGSVDSMNRDMVGCFGDLDAKYHTVSREMRDMNDNLTRVVEQLTLVVQKYIEKEEGDKS